MGGCWAKRRYFTCCRLFGAKNMVIVSVAASWLDAAYFITHDVSHSNHSPPLTMTIQVKYFASLRERFGRDEERITSEGVGTVAEVWAIISDGERLPEQLLCAVNMDYADPATVVRRGDEVGFFPPVTGG